MDEPLNLLFFDFLSEPRIELKEKSNVVNPAAIMHNKPYSYDEPIDGSQIAFFCRSKYESFFQSLAEELISALSNQERYGLEIPSEKAKPIVYESNPLDLNSIVNEVIRKSNAKLCVIGLPPNIIEKKYFEIKARFLGEGVRVQLIKDDDFRSKYDQLSEYAKEKVLYNLATAIYTKLDGTPWILSEPMAEPKAIIVGIGFGKVKEGYYVGTSYVKDIYGIDIDFKLIPKFGLLDVATEGLYLPQDELKNLMDHLIGRFNPQAIYLYKTSRFIPKEIETLKKYTDKVKLVLVYINRSKPLRAFENRSTIRRGLFVGLKGASLVNTFKKVKFFLWTTGNLIIEESGRAYNHRLGTPKGLEVEVLTNSDEINVNDDTSILEFEKNIGKQILALTKLNWNTIEWEIREPAITTFARKAAKIAAELERLNLGASRTYDIRDFI